jgi:predicted acetylornithine/succinylornithine family transaminase
VKGKTLNPQAIIEAESQYIVHTYTRPPFVLTHGEGTTLYDSDGNAYADWVSGIAVNALGYADPEITAAIQSQAEKLIHVCNLYHTAPHVELARALCDASFADRVFFCNSGSESVETALKIARKFSRVKHGEGKTGVVAFTGGFHGRTMGALSATARPKYQEPFAPLVPGVTIADFNDLDSAGEAIGDDTCAVIIEPVQGEGGIHPAADGFLAGLRDLCDEHSALLIFDEVQCGMGRTGTLWAHEAYDVTPDMMTLAKPLASGLPIGATLATEAVAAVMQPGDHGSTFAAGPLVTTVAKVVFARVSQPDFLANVREVGSYLIERLSELNSPHVQAVRGRGLMIGIDLDIEANQIVEAGYTHGLILVNAGPNVLRLVPPLIVSREDVDALFDKLAAILSGLDSGGNA